MTCWLKAIVLDAHALSQVRDIIQHQFDVQIMLKRKETLLISERLEQTRDALRQLQDQSFKGRSPLIVPVLPFSNRIGTRLMGSFPKIFRRDGSGRFFETTKACW